MNKFTLSVLGAFAMIACVFLVAACGFLKDPKNQAEIAGDVADLSSCASKDLLLGMDAEAIVIDCAKKEAEKEIIRHLVGDMQRVGVAYQQNPKLGTPKFDAGSPDGGSKTTGLTHGDVNRNGTNDGNVRIVVLEENTITYDGMSIALCAVNSPASSPCWSY